MPEPHPTASAPPTPTPDGSARFPAGTVPPSVTLDNYPFLAPPQAADELGRLGPYRLLGVLGRGGMGVVFAADEPALGRRVALKVMLPHVAHDPAARARFTREAKAQAAVEHEHVAVIHAVGEDRGVPFLAMPLLKGMTLADALKSGVPCPVPEALRIAREMAEGLAAAHAKGLVHRDIKPANVWLDGDRRRVKILDFGLARATDAGGDPADPVTGSGVVIGTPAYMSPEQANGHPLDARTDLFSLGTVLYELLAGRRPFQAATTPALLVAVAYENPPPPSALNPHGPPALDGLVAWLMAKDPAGRPPSAGAAANALRAAEADLARMPAGAPASGSQPVPVAESDPWAGLMADDPETDPGHTATTDRPAHIAGGTAQYHRSRGGLPWLLAGGAAVMAVGVAAFVLTRGGPAKPTAPEDVEATKAARSTAKATPMKPGPALDADRRAALALLPHGLSIDVRPVGFSKQVTLRSPNDLPPDPFVVGAVYTGSRSQVGAADFVERVVVPEVSELRSLGHLSVFNGAGPCSEETLVRLATSPCARGLNRLGLRFQLTPRTLGTLKKFPSLSNLQCLGHDVDDTVLLQLTELRLTGIQIASLGLSGRVTEAGWIALASLPLQTIQLGNPRIDGPAARALSKAKLHSLWLSECRFETGALAALAASNSIKTLKLSWNKEFLDDDLAPLRAAHSIPRIELRGAVKVTEKGIQELSAALPMCEVIWEDRHFRAGRDTGKKEPVMADTDLSSP